MKKKFATAATRGRRTTLTAAPVARAFGGRGRKKSSKTLSPMIVMQKFYEVPISKKLAKLGTVDCTIQGCPHNEKKPNAPV